MGGKRTGAGKHFYRCAAVALLTSLAACSTIGGLSIRDDAYSHLRRVEPLMVQHDFEGALREGQVVIDLVPASPPADEALFDMALVYAHPANPKKDYRRSIALFARVVREFPESPRVEEARIWIGVLETIEKSKQVDADIEELKKGLVK